MIMPDEKKLKLKDLKLKISTWGNRLEMAKMQGNQELLHAALEQKRKYQNELAKLQEVEVGKED
jgi:hypothetical protein